MFRGLVRVCMHTCVCVPCSVCHPGWLNEAGDGFVWVLLFYSQPCKCTQTGILKNSVSRAGNCSPSMV